MTHPAFDIVREEDIPEVCGRIRLLRHRSTGAEVMSVENDDENKVFGITFRTPPFDSTGVAHILEHTVLCGSRRYPLKDPFVQLLKGSHYTFLNAMTYPDKTCYPVASCHPADFFNLAEVYFDAVFHPRLAPEFFRQEGWHCHLPDPDGELTISGVVYNEMKGVYSSPDDLLETRSIQSLFPDTPYGVDSGGHPATIPDLSYESFKAFHQTYYHPSNARIFFYGNDDAGHRLEWLDARLQDFGRREVDSAVPMQPPLPEPVEWSETYEASSPDARPWFTRNWLLDAPLDPESYFTWRVLDEVLLGTPASPLRKALIESGYGEDLTGGGLESQLRQMVFSAGLKNVAPVNLDAAASLIDDTLTDLAERGLPSDLVESALNTIRFALRENNTGGAPRGLAVMLRSMKTWLYDGDPLSLVAHEAPFETVAARAAEPGYLEGVIREGLIENPNRSRVILRPDPDHGTRMREAEQARIDRIAESLTESERERITEETRELHRLQSEPDRPEDLARIPRLRRADMKPGIKPCPRTVERAGDGLRLTHERPCAGIVYFDLGFDLGDLPARLLPWMGVYTAALLEMGTTRRDYVELSRRIARDTGGLHPVTHTGAVFGENRAATHFFLRGKCLREKTAAMTGLMGEVLTEPDFTNRDRFLQIVLEHRASLESALIPNGHGIAIQRARAHLHPAHRRADLLGGVETLFFLRDLESRVRTDWDRVLADLQDLHRRVVRRNAVVAHLTCDGEDRAEARRAADRLVDGLESASPCPQEEEDLPACTGAGEALTLPSEVNYVARVLPLTPAGCKAHGSSSVVSRLLQTGRLWEELRMKGGAYGALCGLDPASGLFHFGSYRDPHIRRSLDVYRATAEWLKTIDLPQEDLDHAVVGAVGAMDRYRLPDAEGYNDLIRLLAGYTDELRQRHRDELLAATAEDLRAFGASLEAAESGGVTVVVGSESALERENVEGLSRIPLMA
ncbi:insulinase family protein [Kiritimatiella glycovorans]|uniref:Peptidase M16C associated n=1 Tax=Kiritimatiella glycovorans TaxID=1307763 RepID=A0A0G3EHU3_9BACT|nr:insulinase family protein [Kiritimatiella glycovorans]AKJ64370.1 Peptidase M16C associated [Kiritimatiella glycovorans]